MRFFLTCLLMGCPAATPTDVPTDNPVVPPPSPEPLIDADGDGVAADSDCDDADPLVFPGAVERCNGLDDDCSGAPHEGEADGDGDGLPDCAPCDAEGFWGPTLELEGSELIAALNDLTAAHNCTDYQDERRYMFVSIDKKNGVVECVYTGRTTPVGNTEPSSSDINTEHTWPRSQGAGTEPAECDIHHLFPSDAMTNSRRGSYPFGHVVSSTWAEGGSSLGTDANGDQVFEPRDVHKGNAARALLYFGMRYGYVIEPDYQALLVEWSSFDPVDSAEIERSLAIRDRQGATNPFVVCPQLVDQL